MPLHTWNDLLGVVPGRHRRKDRAHRRRRLVRGRRGATARVHDLRGHPRQPDARAAQLGPRPAARLGRLALPHADARRPAGRSCARRFRTAAPVALVAPRPLVWLVRVGPADRRARDRAVGDGAARPAWAGARPDRGLGRRAAARHRARWSPPGRSPGPDVGGRLRWYATRTVQDLLGLHPVIVTVTLNAAIDRTLTVPNVQLGHRHRASARFTSAGGKGINVARALKRLETPVIATGLAGGRTGRGIVEELAARGDPQRLRAHLRRVAHVDRGRRPDRRHR